MTFNQVKSYKLLKSLIYSVSKIKVGVEKTTFFNKKINLYFIFMKIFF